MMDLIISIANSKVIDGKNEHPRDDATFVCAHRPVGLSRYFSASKRTGGGRWKYSERFFTARKRQVQLRAADSPSPNDARLEAIRVCVCICVF